MNMNHRRWRSSQGGLSRTKRGREGEKSELNDAGYHSDIILLVMLAFIQRIFVEPKKLRKKYSSFTT